MILDIGPQSAKALAEITARPHWVWNGPVGVSEMDSFANAPRFWLQAAAFPRHSRWLAAATPSRQSTYSDRGQGRYISDLPVVSFEFLEGKRLPVVDILESRFDK